MKTKLTTLETRARNWARTVIANNGTTFTVDWAKSSTWGLCPRIIERGSKIAHASGCGYCKHSAVLAQALCWLFEPGTDAHNRIASCAGAGVSTVAARLAEYGWKLESPASGPTYDVWTLTKI